MTYSVHHILLLLLSSKKKAKYSPIDWNALVNTRLSTHVLKWIEAPAGQENQLEDTEWQVDRELSKYGVYWGKSTPKAQLINAQGNGGLSVHWNIIWQ